MCGNIAMINLLHETIQYSNITQLSIKMFDTIDKLLREIGTDEYFPSCHPNFIISITKMAHKRNKTTVFLLSIFTKK